MSSLDPVILNEVKAAQKSISDLSAVAGVTGPTEYPWKLFTSSTEWTVPDDGEYMIICVGGGGNGGGGGGSGNGGGYGSGGGGGYGWG